MRATKDRQMAYFCDVIRGRAQQLVTVLPAVRQPRLQFGRVRPTP